MRIRSGHLLIGAGASICALVAIVFLFGGGTAASRSTEADKGASLPPEGSAPDAIPVIEVETTEKDMGIVSNKEHTTKPFRIKNTGKGTLKILEVKTSCACTQGHIPTDGLIIPGLSEKTFDIEIDPYRIPGFLARRVLTIMSNDIKKPQIEVGVTSHVDPEFSMDPEELDFGDVPKGTEEKRTMIIRQIRPEPFEIKELNTFGMNKKDGKNADALSSSDDFTFAVVKRPDSAWKTPGKTEFELSIGLTPHAHAGPLDGKFVFAMTTIPRLPAMPLMLKGKIVAPYKLTPLAPQKLNIKGDMATGHYEPVYATISADSPVSIENITPTKSTVVATAEPSATANEAKIKVTISPDAPAGPIEEDLDFTIVIDGKKYPERVGVRSFGIGKQPAQKP